MQINLVNPNSRYAVWINLHNKYKNPWLKNQGSGFEEKLFTDQGAQLFELPGAAQLFILMGNEFGIFTHENLANGA